MSAALPTGAARFAAGGGFGAPASRSAALDVPDWVRAACIATIMFVTVVGAGGFHDLRSVSNISVSENGDRLNQILFGSVGLIVLGVIYARWRVLTQLASWPVKLTAVWFLITTVVSTQPALSARRLIMLMIVLGSAACVYVIARSVRQMALLFVLSALAIMVVCYVSMLIVPDLTIHTAQDVREPEHAGSWRGVFPHKNEAGAMMAWFTFIGLFAASAASPVLGYALTILSVVFLAFTQAKTPIALLPLTLIQSYLCVRWRSAWARALVVAGPLALMLLLSVGTVILPPVKELVHMVAPGVTYTGRTEIWEFTVDNIMRRPITGFGYGAFWQTESTFYGTGDAQSWVNQAGDAHNGYLNTAVDIGIPGLVLTLVWLVWEPLRNMQRGLTGARLDATDVFLLRCWSFGLLDAVFEGLLYHPTNGGFFIILTGVFGLQLRTRAYLKAA